MDLIQLFFLSYLLDENKEIHSPFTGFKEKTYKNSNHLL